MVIVAAVWSVAVGVAGIEIESGERGKMLIGCYLFTPRGTLLANSFLGLSYAGTLWLMQLQGHPYAPTLMDWVDILLVRIPLIYIV